MPPLPPNGFLRLPVWAAWLPWLLLAVSVAGGVWMASDLHRQLTDKEEINASLRRQAGSNPLPPTLATPDSLRRYGLRTTLELAKARDWTTAYTLLPEYLTGVVKLLGPAPELREIAVTGLTAWCSSVLEHRSEQSPAFSADSRWIISRLADGTIVFTDVNSLDPTSWHLKAGAGDFRIDASFLYYQTGGGWQRATLSTPPDGMAELGPAEAFPGTPPEPAAPPSPSLVLPKVGGTPVQLSFQGGSDPKTPVHPLKYTGSTPYSVVLAPDGRFAAVWSEKGVIQIWRLAILREHLSRLGLDWNVPEFPPAVNDEKIEGSVKGAEPVRPAWRTTPPAKSVSSVSTPPHSKSAVSNESSARDFGDKAPRRRVVLPTTD